MKTKISTTFIAMVLGTAMYSQDIIILKNGNEVKAKVLEVAPSEIKYKKFDNQDGPTYTDFKSNVFMIRYESGAKDLFNGQVPVSVPSTEITSPESKESTGYRPD